MTLRIISGVMAATSCRIAPSELPKFVQSLIPKGKSFSYQEEPPVDQLQSGCEMQAVLLPATRHFL